jgi:site-specific DNA recombinase
MASEVKTKRKKKEVEDTRIKAIGYCRVSTDRQAEEGDSFMVQSDKIRGYAAAKNLNLLEIIQESCSGGVAPRKRPRMKEVLQMIKDGKANAIVVAKLDRFSRSLKDVILTLDKFEKDKVHFVCIEPEIDTTSAFGTFLLHLFGALAQMEKTRIVARTKETMAAKRERNHLIGAVPFGFRVELQGKDKVLVPEEREQLLTTRIKAMRATQIIGAKGRVRPMSYQAICDVLKKEEVLNKNGTTNWFPSQIRRICFDGEYRGGRKKQERKQAESESSEEEDDESEDE